MVHGNAMPSPRFCDIDASAPHYLSALRAKAALLPNRLHAVGCLVNGKRICVCPDSGRAQIARSDAIRILGLNPLRF